MTLRPDTNETSCFVNRNGGPVFTRIAGVGVHLPDQIVTSTELDDALRASGIEVPPNFIERSTGVRERRVAASGENASDLAVRAAQQALEQAGLTPLDVDLLIWAAASQDVLEPATAHIVQSKLGADRAYVFDLKNACNSVLSAVDVADCQIRLGRARVVLIATGEIPSLYTDKSFRSRDDFAGRFSHLTMGDAGTALVLTATERQGQGLLATAAVSRGDDWRLATVLSFGTMHPTDLSPDRANLRTQGPELEARGRREIPLLASAIFEATGWDATSVEVVAGHQHSGRLARELAAAFGVDPERVMLPLQYAGNAVAANIPLGLFEAQRRGLLQEGTRVFMCGGSSGFSGIAMALVW
jgi:3-oxoacyl-[acyl-carrier-protein] synthase-3